MGTTTIIRVKLYELLRIFIKLDYKLINTVIWEQANLFECIVNDYEANDSNSNVLVVLNRLIIEIACQ